MNCTAQRSARANHFVRGDAVFISDLLELVREDDEREARKGTATG
jgi:hypothetical protein